MSPNCNILITVFDMDSMIAILYKWQRELAESGRAIATVSLRVSHIRRLLSDIKKPVGEITLNDLKQWLAGHQWMPSTRESVQASFRLFWQWCIQEGYCKSDITAKLPKIRRPKAVPKPVPDEVITKAMATASSMKIRLAIELMAMCGLRRAECASLHSRDIQAAGSGFMLRVRGKGGHVRLIPCPPHLAKAIQAAGGWVFPGRSNSHICPEWLGKRVSRALPPEWTAHKLRHRYATVTYQKSHDIRAVQELLGHSSVATTQVYVAVSEDAVRAAASAAWEISA